VPKTRRTGSGESLTLRGATLHNLKNVTAEFPLGKLVAVTGLSGSGKSSLITGTLYPILARALMKAEGEPGPHASVDGLQHLDKVIEIDQSPIGRTPRSNPATYTKLWDPVRDLFAQMPESKLRGYAKGRFSFNVKGGRCEESEGAGVKLVEMQFLAPVAIECETCEGTRFNP
jgi:excinuclease ABC subunit A